MVWIKVLQGLLTPIIAAFVAYIAYQQHKTNRDKLRLDLYDRRYKVFHSVVSLLQHILGRKKLDDERLCQFHAATIQGIFLFEKDLSDYLDKMFREANSLCFLEAALDQASLGSDRKGAAEEKQKLMKWFSEQFDTSKDMFRRYLDFRAIGKRIQKGEKTATQTGQHNVTTK